MPIERPLAITKGDPAGIGPEIVVKLFNETRKTTEKPFRGIVVGDVDRINQANDIVNANLNVKRKEHIHQCTCQPGHIEVLQVGPCTADLPFGKLHKRAGQWFRGQDLFEDAVKHLFLSGDNDAAADYLDASILSVTVWSSVKNPCDKGFGILQKRPDAESSTGVRGFSRICE